MDPEGMKNVWKTKVLTRSDTRTAATMMRIHSTTDRLRERTRGATTSVEFDDSSGRDTRSTVLVAREGADWTASSPRALHVVAVTSLS
jgi:hypothetical protein